MRKAVHFPDKVLEAAIRRTLHLNEDAAITGAVLATLKSLTVATIGGVSCLSGLEQCTRLESFWTGGQGLKDGAPLASLPRLQELGLFNTNIRDIVPLASLNNLRMLYLWHTHLRNPEPLAQLSSLNALYLVDNQIQDTAPFASLTALKELWLSNNRIRDITPLQGLVNLEELRLDRNRIRDLGPLRTLINLKRLRLGKNQNSGSRPDSIATQSGRTYSFRQSATGYPSLASSSTSSPIGTVKTKGQLGYCAFNYPTHNCSPSYIGKKGNLSGCFPRYEPCPVESRQRFIFNHFLK